MFQIKTATRGAQALLAKLDARKITSLGTAIKIVRGGVPDIPGRISGMADALSGACGDSEASFLAIGETLRKVHSGTSRMTRQTLETLELIGGDSEDNHLARLGRIAENAQAGLRRHQDDVAENLSQVKAMAEHLESLFLACDEIDRIAMNLRVVGTNIGIESTRSPEAREMFTVVSQEIVHLSEKVDGLSLHIRVDVGDAKSELLGAHESIQKGLNELKALADGASRTVRNAVSEIRQCMARVLDTFELAGEQSRKISKEVGRIVASIQFHDSMRQRIEHIIEAMDRVRPLLQSRNGGETRSEQLRSAYEVVRLQKMQLVDVLMQIDSTHALSVESFRNIGTEVSDLAASFAGLCEDGGSQASCDLTWQTTFDGLKAALEGLAELIHRGGGLVSRIQTSITRACDISTRMSDYLRQVGSISFETHIKALNAIVKSAHLGDQGRTLEVLAHEMNNLSNQTHQFVAHVEEKLTRVSAAADRLQHKADGEEPGESTSDVALSAGMEDVDRIFDKMRAGATSAAASAADLHATITRAGEQLRFLPSLAEDMHCSLTELEDFEARLLPFSGQGREENTSDTHELAATYTMQRERDVHERLVDTAGIASVAALSSATVAAGDVDISPGGPVDEDAFSGDSGDATAFEDSEENAEENAGENAGDEDFGDNVELF